jgi:hypothetical protein
MREKKVWTGSYKGIGFEIDNWKTPPNSIDLNGQDHWTYYLYLHIDRIPEENDPNSYWLKGEKQKSYVSYNYNDHGVINNIEWHGGITWYSKESGFDGGNKIIKVGCDYSHIWDEGYSYNADMLEHDVKKAIDSFLVSVPNYKRWCCGNGKLYNIAEGIIKDNKFYSKEYYGKEGWFKKLDKQKAPTT